MIVIDKENNKLIVDGKELGIGTPEAFKISGLEVAGIPNMFTLFPGWADPLFNFQRTCFGFKKSFFLLNPMLLLKLELPMEDH
jgi:hypothetical protein